MDAISLSYANALISLANDNNKNVKDYINSLKEINSSFDDEIKKFLFSKAINSSNKKEILGNALASYDKTVLGFLYVLVDNNRINKLDDIIKALIEQDNRSAHKALVKVTVANKLNDNEIEDLKQAIKNRLAINEDIEINEIIDSSIIQGLIVEYQGKVLDLSLLNKQKSLKEFLEK